MSHQQKGRLLYMFAIINDTCIEWDYCPLCELKLNFQKEPLNTVALNLSVTEHKAFLSSFEAIYEVLAERENKVTFLSYMLLHYKLPKDHGQARNIMNINFQKFS